MMKLSSNIDKSQVKQVIKISATGYCDDTGSKRYNDSLSYYRASSVKTILTNEFINYENIHFETQGKGSITLDKSLASPTDKVRSKNRRTDVYIIYEGNNTILPPIKPIIKEEPKFTIGQLNIGETIILSNILFEPGRAVFLSKSTTDLNHLVEELKTNTSYHIKITGHINYSPSNTHNLPNNDSRDLRTGKPLSTERAKAVYDYLIHNKIDKTRLSYEGLGGMQPTREGGIKNRRVEIKIIKK